MKGLGFSLMAAKFVKKLTTKCYSSPIRRIHYTPDSLLKMSKLKLNPQNLEFGKYISVPLAQVKNKSVIRKRKKKRYRSM